MQIATWMIFVAIELLTFLLIACILLGLYARRLKAMLRRLQEKLHLALDDLKQSRSQCQTLQETANQASPAYLDHIAQQLDQTHTHHQALDPAADISRGPDAETSLEQQVAALRHAFLLTEQQAMTAADNDQQPDWATIQARLGDLLNALRPHLPPASEETGETKSGASSAPSGGVTQVVDVVKTGSFQAADELDRLKSVAANQHRLITELQQRLARAYSSDEKEAVIGDLNKQLEQQLRFVEESETCIEQMENELSQARRQITQLEAENEQLAAQLQLTMSSPGGDSSV